MPANEKITIQTNTPVQGPTGWDDDWKTSETRWAKIIVLPSDTRLRYQQLDAVTEYRIEFRGSISITLDKTRFIRASKNDEILVPSALPIEPEAKGRFTVVMVRDTGEVYEE